MDSYEQAEDDLVERFGGHVSRSMPSNHAFQLNQNQGPFPATPKLSQSHPKQFVGRRKSRLQSPPFQNSRLLSQHEMFQD
jgi:hypothetical protein